MGNVQAGEEIDNLIYVAQLAQSSLEKLPSPIEPYGEEQRRL